MPKLKTNPSLPDFQEYVKQLEAERGFSGNTSLQNALMLGEEVGELFKAIRKAEKMKLDANSQVGNLSEEMADILIYLCSIANRYDINLEEAFRSKEDKNKQRVWAA